MQHHASAVFGMFVYKIRLRHWYKQTESWFTGRTSFHRSYHQTQKSAFPDWLHIGVEPLLGIFENNLSMTGIGLGSFRKCHFNRGLGLEIIAGDSSANSVNGLLTLVRNQPFGEKFCGVWVRRFSVNSRLPRENHRWNAFHVINRRRLFPFHVSRRAIVPACRSRTRPRPPV